MTLPLRMNPMEVHIKLQGQPNRDSSNEQIDQYTITMGDDNEVQFGYDEDFREPSGARDFSEPIVLTPQVATRDFKELRASMTGDEERQDGHLTFRKSDLDEAGISLENGDRIVKMGDFDVDIMIDQVRPLAPLRGKFLLLQVDYKRNISKRSSET
jgi:hypothetical protein